MIKAAFFDVDGTLLAPDHRVPESTWRALRAIREKGVKTIISTGRATNEMPDGLMRGFDSYVLINGQLCFDGDGVFRDVHIAADDARVIAGQVEAGLYDVIVQLRDTAFANALTPDVLRVADIVGLEYEVGDVERMLYEPVYQLNVMLDAKDEDILLSKTSRVRTTRWTDSFCDVIPVDGGKHLGVRAALERLGVEPGEAVAFGDGENDISMFETVGTSVAMGNARDDVKRRATHVTTAVDDDGIWNACLKLGLV